MNSPLNSIYRGSCVGEQSVSSSASVVTVDLRANSNYTHTLTENTTLGAPLNAVAGQSGVIMFKQHASAVKTLAFNSFWKFSGGTVPTITATVNAFDALAYYIAEGDAGPFAVCQLIKDVK